ncbi:hypothetical protein ABZW96_09200 [Nocardia sp. NPDC004168]
MPVRTGGGAATGAVVRTVDVGAGVLGALVRSAVDDADVPVGWFTSRHPDTSRSTTPTQSPTKAAAPE